MTRALKSAKFRPPDDPRSTTVVTAVRKGCAIAEKLRRMGVRPYGVVRIDSASGPGDWAKDPEGNQKKIAETFRQAADVAEGMLAAGQPQAARSG